MTNTPDTPTPLTAMTPEESALRRRYSDAALAALPRLLTLIDRNQYSPTYGCFDRAYWHYRTMDFPCGMSQEFVLPLALAWRHDFPGNPYHRLDRLRELALASIDFARRSAHPDGTCDDYFPFERALGALVFSLYSMTESCLVLGEKPPEALEFFARRGDWLLGHNETGQLANHQAFAALALQNVYTLTGEERFRRGVDKYIGIVRDWQSPEGWFQEYEGADPGYHSCSIAFLAKLWQKNHDPALLDLLGPAVDFAHCFMHPDGSYAGEYGSRNTYHFYPHGFEVLAGHFPKAGAIADHFLRQALPRSLRYFNDDDRMCAHYVYDWMQAYLDYHPGKTETIADRQNFTRYFEQAGILVRQTDDYYCVTNLSKGGVTKITTPAGPVAGDTGLIGRTEAGRVLVMHQVDPQNEFGYDAESATAHVKGRMFFRKSKLPTPFKQVLFRLLNLTLGRFWPNALRAVLQKILITGKPRSEVTFERQIRLEEARVTVTDTLERPEGSPPWTSLHRSTDATSIYVANSNVFQRSVLLPWEDLSDHLNALNTTGRVEITHEWFPAADAPLLDREADE